MREHKDMKEKSELLALYDSGFISSGEIIKGEFVRGEIEAGKIQKGKQYLYMFRKLYDIEPDVVLTTAAYEKAYLYQI